MIIEYEEDTEKLFPDVPILKKIDACADRELWRTNFNDTFKLKERAAQNEMQVEKIEEEISYYNEQRIMIK